MRPSNPLIEFGLKELAPCASTPSTGFGFGFGSGEFEREREREGDSLRIFAHRFDAGLITPLLLWFCSPSTHMSDVSWSVTHGKTRAERMLSIITQIIGS